MSLYDIALDHQIEWSSFWISDYGLALYHSIGRVISRKRAEKGELYSGDIVDTRDDDYAVEMMPLLNGDCFYWSREMSDLVCVASQSLPDSWFLMKQHIPAISGFFWFATELPNEYSCVRAFGWTVLTFEGDVTRVHLPRQDISMPDFNAIALITFTHNPEFPKPLPCRSLIDVGQTLSEWRLKQSDYIVSINADPSEFTLEYLNIRLFATMLSFIQQRILVTSRHTTSRATRRRANAAKRQAEAEVSIVKLRREVHHAHKGKGVPVEWNCQWIVSGHWRDQWYPSMRTHQPVWIRPYVKGPEDKPLRNSSKLFAVVR